MTTNPFSIEHEGRTFWSTGKTGHRVSTGEHAAEYADDDDCRVWRTESGKVYPE